jgi:hypothetical protein
MTRRKGKLDACRARQLWDEGSLSGRIGELRASMLRFGSERKSTAKIPCSAASPLPLRRHRRHRSAAGWVARWGAAGA